MARHHNIPPSNTPLDRELIRDMPLPLDLPDMPGAPWTPDLGLLVTNNPELLMLARLLRDEAGQDNIRGIWNDIDRSVAQSVQYARFEPENQLKPDRVFAGISQNGRRYIEVYEKQAQPGAFGVFIADTTHNDNRLICMDGLQNGEPGPNGDFWVSFTDPGLSTPEKFAVAALHLRRLDDGTSSYFGEAGNTGSYDGEYLPIGYMQDIVRFDTDNLRGSLLDGQGIPHGMLIDVTPPPLQNQSL
ncbi:MAG TPA: hypothetical protein VGO07_05705 [Candidatus Saccharimonadales bacterium]|nr:hypothetical protein [Candidatus Saccharimonadales bacterium]